MLIRNILFLILLFASTALADLGAKVGSFAISTGAATTTQTISGVGFQPKLIIFWWSGRVTAVDAVGRATHVLGRGATDGTNRWANAGRSADALGTSETSRRTTNLALIMDIDSSGNEAAAADIDAMLTDGFRIIIDNQFASAFRIHYLALGGSDITGAFVGTYDVTAGTGNFSVTGVGFQPEFVFFSSPMASDTAEVAGTDGQTGDNMGAAVSSTARATLAGSSFDALGTSDTASYIYSGEALSGMSSTSSMSRRYDFVSMDADGFTINRVENNPVVQFYAALAGPSFTVGTLTTQTDTTTDIAESGLGFQPSAIMFFSAGRAESTADTPTADEMITIGAGTGTTERGVQAIRDEDNVATTEVTTAIEFDAVYANLSSGAIAGLMDIKSIDSDGFTAIMDDADPSGMLVWYWAIGNPSAIGLTPAGIINNPLGF